LIFYEGCKPIRANKNWFFKDKVFKERASMAPAQIKGAAGGLALGRTAGLDDFTRQSLPKGFN